MKFFVHEVLAEGIWNSALEKGRSDLDGVPSKHARTDFTDFTDFIHNWTWLFFIGAFSVSVIKINVSFINIKMGRPKRKSDGTQHSIRAGKYEYWRAAGDYPPPKKQLRKAEQQDEEASSGDAENESSDHLFVTDRQTKARHVKKAELKSRKSEPVKRVEQSGVPEEDGEMIESQ